MNKNLRIAVVAGTAALLMIPVTAMAGTGQPPHEGPGGITPPGGMDVPDGFEFPGGLQGDLICWAAEMPGGPPEGVPICEEGQLPIELPPDLALVCWPAGIPFDPPEGVPVCEEGQLPIELPEHVWDKLVCWPADLPFDPPEGLPVCAEGQLPIEIPQEVMDKLVCWPAEIPYDPPEGLPVCEEGQLPIELPDDLELVCWPAEIPYDPPQGVPICEQGQDPFPAGEGMACWPAQLPIEPPEGVPVCEPGELPDNDSLTMLFPAFEDVPVYSEYYPAAQGLYYSGVLAGCSEGPRDLCASEPFRREEMAVVLNRAYIGAGVVPEAPSSPPFNDVPVESWSSRWINALKQSGLTAGCRADGTAFCPQRPVSRGEIAAFALKLEHGQSFVPPDGPAVSAFADLNSDQWAYDWLVRAYEEGLITACGQTGLTANICPDDVVLRDEAAQILALAMGIVKP